ncbi:branched-chain amino acid ABC transporter permease [Deinococcus radiodurans]|jgi:amino acid/amide ABC transporter membrane protein 2, HAAT family (TC 3.A.1.4.-)|uniref:Branched-chain amino acid ABC transporter, permease protein n=1 Tax=Deinococcus radiodurans (strain ATCC 13939 / DSM 20539 / JCM 16871 / CCUG 27074 / LMG 4051 / NBRC 15346 / NCIMB 9279 / VKM B-1422 / R1) TaxID=243230 RepID=Q9RSK4_DEIRA|nr:branched-chain amino acid ABC transporter permease [Deinococcus radiodurans]AAF11670.1 branched-chain amino acid ABC transporter, permease protein [Deinococcus radiodurans R1 = ATCC 13939 = DSM 20539]ANC70817.1 branched-chain amino acid ABC transporter permease [Deinococcus radiodurans R1 = ATCC 13939 = DSM 20539]QEM71508.1 branched-chain amino acid ABC transporter permease [Deinococcus radiodurans]QIP27830.1 branched-chain amino acid ABC transporter permease [Deinococcus radiodurans]QIP312
MTDFFSTYGALIVMMVQAGLLGLSLYFPLQAGQLSLATPGFYALGGYVAAILLTNPAFAGLRDTLGNGMFPLTWLAAALLCGVLGLILGIPALRLRGIYLALATIAFVQIMQILALNLSITGGAIGIFAIPQAFGFDQPLQYLWLFGPLLLLTLLFARQLSRSRVGRAFHAIREDELAADAMGINPTHYKVLAFVIGAVLAGLVGALSAPFLNTWNAKQGTFDASIAVLAFVLIGGSRNMWGPVVGGALLTAVPEVLRFLADWRLVINGLVLVVASLYLPQGIVGALERWRRPAPPRRPADLPPVTEVRP